MSTRFSHSRAKRSISAKFGKTVRVTACSWILIALPGEGGGREWL